MSNPYYNASGVPVTGAAGLSAVIRSEYNAIAAGFALLPALTAGTAVVVNPGGTALTNTTGALALAGNFTTTGAFNTTLAQAASVTLTLPATNAALAGINIAQTWTAAQTFTNSDLLLLGSSTGATTFTSANAGASNFTITVPAVTDTVAVLGAKAQVFSGGLHVPPFNIGTVSSGTTTIDAGNGPQQFLTNNGAFTLAAPAADGNCLLYILNGASAGTITFSGFTVGSFTGAALTNTSGNKFILSIFRINGVSGYSSYALQ